MKALSEEISIMLSDFSCQLPSL